jgi:N-methylhydantoinase A/oxoprolinase/acetone carboxylase beta subunit
VLARGDDLTPGGLARRFTPLVATAERELGAEGYGRSRRAITRQLDVRYAGQSYEITLPFSPAYRDEFDRLHHQRYGYSNADRPIEVVNVRVQAAGHSAKPRLPYAKPRRRARPVAHARRAARVGGRAMSAAVYRWADLLPGSTAPGPAIVTGAEATAVVPPGWRFTVDGHGNVVASKATTRTKTRTRRS